MANPVSSINRPNAADEVQQTQRAHQTVKKHQTQAPKNPGSLAQQDKVTLSRNQSAKQNRNQRQA